MLSRQCAGEGGSAHDALLNQDLPEQPSRSALLRKGALKVAPRQEAFFDEDRSELPARGVS